MLKSKIEKPFEIHSKSRICQGDILRDVNFLSVHNEGGIVKEILLPYLIVISQDCDIEQFLNSNNDPLPDGVFLKNNQYLPNILFLPAFIEEHVRSGIYLKDLYNITTERLNSDLYKPITKNKNDRYHFIKGFKDYQIPNLIVDFKNYFTLPVGYFQEIYKTTYLATINELFRENLSVRFSNYLSRIALPEIIDLSSRNS
jgi:hypothetical protein